MVEYSENIINIVSALLVILFGLIITNILSNIVKKLLKDIEINRIIKEQLKINIKLEDFAAASIKYLIYLITAILALKSLGLSIRILQILFIVIFIAIILFVVMAFKDWIPNLVSGFYIIKNNKIVKGDKITINSISGKVLGVNMLETKIETNNKEIIFIPNASINKYQVFKNGKSIRSNTNRRRRSK